jgi:hypothetical protein
MGDRHHALWHGQFTVFDQPSYAVAAVELWRHKRTDSHGEFGCRIDPSMADGILPRTRAQIAADEAARAAVRA